MPLRFLFPLVCAAFLPLFASSQEPIRYARTPDISPDGKQVTFSYKGDIWVVETIGGVARPVTLHEAHDAYPSFSPDGRSIAFSSNRNGSYDVFVVSAFGGKPKRLTFDSAADFALGWTPDGKNILFSSTRSTDFPTGMTLYSVPVEGGPETPLAVKNGKDVAFSPKGDRLAYVRGPGTWYRRGYRGSSNDDIWLANPDGTQHVRVTDFNGDDGSPMWSPDGRRLYYVSEQLGGPANVVYVDITATTTGTQIGKPQKLTRHTDDGIHRARISRNGEWIVYECGLDLWVASTKDGSSRKIAIEAYVDDKVNPEKLVTSTNGATDFSPNPSETHIAFVIRGAIFLMPQTGGKAIRLTNHTAFDHGVSWSPDGKKIIFLSDRDGHENLYQLDPDDTEHPEITAAHQFKVKQLTNFSEAVSGAVFSPDGKRIAFLRAGKLWSMNPDGTDVKVVVSEQQVIDYDWSPDSKSFVYARLDGSWGNELYIVPAAGGKSENITHYATGNYDVTWSNSGMKLAFIAERATPAGMVPRVHVLPLQKPADAKAPSSSEIDWEDIHLRATAVAPMPATACSISPNGSQVAFRATDDLWVVNSNGGGMSRLTNGGAKPTGIRWSKRSPGSIYFRDGSGQIRLSRIGLPDASTIGFTAKVSVNRDEEFAEMFDQSWRLLADAFYDAKHHGADWDAVRAKYRPAVKHITHKEDLYALISLMMGELNASHLGIYGPGPQPEEITADLGILFDDSYKGPGKKISEVLKRGPADKRGLNLKPGELIVAIDRTPIAETTDLSRLLNGKAGETVMLDILANATADPKDPKAKRRVEIQAVQRHEISALMYERWADHNAKRVAEQSGGKIGYIHIPTMDQAGLDRFVRALYSDHFDKEAIVLDVRFNGGGYTHDQVLNYLTGKEHTVFRQRDGGEGYVLRSFDRKWTKPLVVLINNESYSDAEIFPSAFRTTGLGKVVGQPTGGLVIGTSSVTLIDGSTFRIPRIGVYSIRGVNMEKEGVAPDVLVDSHPEDARKGIDPQLEKAVDVVKQDVVAWKKSRGITVTAGGGSSTPGPVKTGP